MLGRLTQSERVAVALSATVFVSTWIAAFRHRNAMLPEIGVGVSEAPYEGWQTISLQVANRTDHPWNIIGLGVWFEPERRLVRATHLDALHKEWRPGTSGLSFGALRIAKHVQQGEDAAIHCYTAPQQERRMCAWRTKMLRLELQCGSERGEQHVANLKIKLKG